MEPSEELRLELVELMLSAVNRCNAYVASYLNDLVLTIRNTFILKFFVVSPGAKVGRLVCATTHPTVRSPLTVIHSP